MTDYSSEADDVKTPPSETRSGVAGGRAISPSRRRALKAALATVPVIMSIKARSAYANNISPSAAASANLSPKVG